MTTSGNAVERGKGTFGRVQKAHAAKAGTGTDRIDTAHIHRLRVFVVFFERCENFGVVLLRHALHPPTRHHHPIIAQHTAHSSHTPGER